MAHYFGGRQGVRVRIVTAREQALSAKETFTAADGERHDDPIADFQVFDTAPTSTTSPIGSWPRMSSFLHRRHIAIEQVKIRSANCRRSDLDDSVSGFEDPRIRHVLDPHVICSHPTQCFHSNLLDLLYERLTCRWLPKISRGLWIYFIADPVLRAEHFGAHKIKG